uniref:Uncharacterized protein n=1 Tax=Panagrolaimus davidi TaxID=227884 RepID=A0A914PJE0_9BILA
MRRFAGVNKEANHPTFNMLDQSVVAQAIQKNAKKLLILNLNDQPYEKKEGEDPGSLAHAKGLLIFLGGKNGIKDGQGFYLQHSCPQCEFGHGFPGNAEKLAQHFFCVTINNEGLYALAEYFYVSHPHFTKRIIPELFKKANKYLNAIDNGEFVDKPVHEQVEFKSYGGKDVTIFTKSIKANRDQLWQDIQMPGVKFFVISHYGGEKWRPESNEDFVVVDYIKAARGGWEIGNEHGKYALSDGDRLCFGDVNYM